MSNTTKLQCNSQYEICERNLYSIIQMIESHGSQQTTLHAQIHLLLFISINESFSTLFECILINALTTASSLLQIDFVKPMNKK